MTNVRALPPTRTPVAPRPQRGLTRALYDTAEALHGPATVKEICQLLPAAIEDSTQIGSKKKIEKTLDSCVYRGYMVRTPDHRYTVAPLSYYEARRKALNELKLTHTPGSYRRDLHAVTDTMSALCRKEAIKAFWVGFGSGITASALVYMLYYLGAHL